MKLLLKHQKFHAREIDAGHDSDDENVGDFGNDSAKLNEEFQQGAADGEGD